MTIRNNESTTVYLNNSLQHWQPGKLQIGKIEYFNDELIGAWDKTKLSDSLKVLDFQIDKMTRNSKI